MINKPHRILYDEAQIACRVGELAKMIEADHTGHDLVMIGILKGSLLFMADLVKKIDLEMEIDFFTSSSYGASKESSGCVKILKGPEIGLKGRHVIIVEDIVDTGLTLKKVYALIEEQEPASIELCALLIKNEEPIRPLRIKYPGFPAGEGFAVGYGLDLAEKYRNLPFIAELT